MAELNALELSDEEFLKRGPEAFGTSQPEEAPAAAKGEAAAAIEVDEAKKADEAGSDDESPEGENKASGDGADSEAREQPEAEADGGEVGESEGDTPKKLEKLAEAAATESLDPSGRKPETKGDTPETGKFDYESAYKRITQPFKANGATVEVTDPDEVVKLMQMGLNYNKKMAALKPHLKIVKMLENNGLLDEQKLSRLVDISKKNPGAIAQFLKESGIDPLDMGTDAADAYRPADHSVSDKEYDLDQVLDALKDSPTFTKTIDVLTKEWDGRSRTAISDNPEIISIIDAHMGNGVFDKVNGVLQREKALGNLKGISDVDAYQQIAQQMVAQGHLRTQAEEAKPAPKANAADGASSETEATSTSTAERDQKRRAVAPVKGTAETKPAEPDSFLGLSDEEFMKRYAGRR